MKDDNIIAVISKIVDRLFKENEDGEHKATLHDIEGRTELAVREIKKLMRQA